MSTCGFLPRFGFVSLGDGQQHAVVDMRHGISKYDMDLAFGKYLLSVGCMPDIMLGQEIKINRTWVLT